MTSFRIRWCAADRRAHPDVNRIMAQRWCRYPPWEQVLTSLLSRAGGWWCVQLRLSWPKQLCGTSRVFPCALTPGILFMNKERPAGIIHPCIIPLTTNYKLWSKIILWSGVRDTLSPFRAVVWLTYRSCNRMFIHDLVIYHHLFLRNHNLYVPSIS